MDYYEELGIERSATTEEIRRAHRRLTRLLHPDQQSDADIKSLAETQMRRLNAIVEVLTNPERRRLYDQSLEPNRAWAGSAAAPGEYVQVVPKQRFRWGSAPWWLGSTIAAVVLTAGVVWFWADRLGSSFGDRGPAYVPSAAQDGAVEAKRSGNSGVASAPERPGAFSRLREALLSSREGSKRNRVAASDRTKEAELEYQSSPTKPVRGAALAESPAPVVGTPGIAEPDHPDSARAFRMEGNPITNSPNPKQVELPAPPKVTANAAPRADVALIPSLPLPAPMMPKPAQPVQPVEASVRPNAVHENRLEGEWVYAPRHVEKRTPGFYAPEFIDLKLFRSGTALHGEYRARYVVTDKRPISPDVNFALSPVDKDAHKFTWQSGNGSRGTLTISSIDPSSIRVEWRTTTFSRERALTAGMATLVRRSP